MELVLAQIFWPDIINKKMKVYDFSNGKKAVDYEIEKLVFLRAYGAESIGASDNIICK